jgi:hypothetical protein
MDEEPKFGFDMSYKHDKQRVHGHLIVECTWQIFGSQLEDQDQTQDEDGVYALVTIGNDFGRKRRT